MPCRMLTGVHRRAARRARLDSYSLRLVVNPLAVRPWNARAGESLAAHRWQQVRRARCTRSSSRASACRAAIRCGCVSASGELVLEAQADETIHRNVVVLQCQHRKRRSAASSALLDAIAHLATDVRLETI